MRTEELQLIIEPTLTVTRDHDGDDETRAVRTGQVAATVIGVLGLAATGWLHLKDLSDKFSETPYLGAGYAALVVAAVTAVFMIATGRRRGWLLGAAACAATIVGFVLTRTTGLPAATGDIGNWSEPAGIYALIAETAVVATAAFTLSRNPRS